MMVPAIDLADIRARVPLRAVLRLYGVTRSMEEREGGFAGECPFCHSTTFEADTTLNRFACAYCGRSGGSVEFVMYRENVAPWIAAYLLADWFRVRVRISNVPADTVKPVRLSPPLSSFAVAAGYALGQLAVALGAPGELDTAVEEILLTARATILGETL